MVYLDTVQVSCLKIGRTSRSSTRKSSRTSFWPVGSHCLSLFRIGSGALGCFRAVSVSTAIVLTSEERLGGLFGLWESAVTFKYSLCISWLVLFAIQATRAHGPS